MSIKILAICAAVCVTLVAKSGEVVLFDAANADMSRVASQDGATFHIKDGLLAVETPKSDGYPGFTVSGDWDVSSCSWIEVEFVDGGIKGKYTVRLLNEGGSPHGGGCYIAKLPIGTEKHAILAQTLHPPSPASWNEVAKKLTRVRTWALPYMTRDNAAARPGWGSLGKHENPCAAIPVHTLDPSKVVQAAVYINTPRRAHAWRVKRIVAKGARKPVPEFVKMPPEKFFPCIDEYGQFMHREWPDKVHSDADLVRQREKEEKDLAAHPGVKGWDKWGGWADGPQLKATGSFRVEKYKGKWWFVDPDGRLWWSHGPVRVTPSGGVTALDKHEDWFARLPAQGDPESLFYTTRDELLFPYYARWGMKRTYDFSAQNIARKYGSDWRKVWADLAHRRLRSWNCNTIANSSDKDICLMDRTPYTDRFEVHARPIAGHKGGWWSFCDPFDPSFREEIVKQLALRRAELADPWCFGLFVDNEHQWGGDTTFARSTLKSPADQPCKKEFVSRLKAKYGEISALNAAWKTNYASWDAMLSTKKLQKMPGAEADLKAFTVAIAEEYYRIIREELKKAAPDKLYFGCRWAMNTPLFSLKAAAKYCDVVSYNIYRKEMSWFKLPEGIDKPVLIGEFHFGALDRGPFCPGLILLKDQEDRARTYRDYVRTSLENPYIVGVHWHQFSDQATAGRFDGENMQVGWTDVCDTPYWETVEAIRDIGARMYAIRSAAVVESRRDTGRGIYGKISGRK